MTEDLSRENEELRRRLGEAEQTIQAHEIPLLLHDSQDALRASEERYRTIVTTTAEGIWMLDTQARTTFVNDRMAAILGYSPEEMLGRSLYDFMDEEARIAAASKFERRESGIQEEHDFSFRRKDGSTVWTRLIGSPIRGSHGEFMGALAMVSDITERRQAEEARARLAAIVESSKDAIFSLSVDGNILTWNASAERLYGYSADEVLGRNISLVVPPDGEAEFQDILEKIRTGQPIRNLETVRRRKDGTEVVVNLSVSPLRDADGRLVGSSSIVRDISERRRLEDERRIVEERFSKVFHESPVAIAITRADGVILEVNRRFSELSGFPLDELAGRTSIEVGLWADPADRLRMTEALSRDGRVHNLEVTFRRKSGEMGAVLLSAESIELQGISPSARLLMLTDVSEIRRTEESLRETRAALEQAQAQAHIGSWSSDSVHAGGVWSAETTRIFGLQAVGFDGRVETFFSMVHPEDLPAVRVADAAFWRDDRPFSIDHRIVRPDGTVRWVHESADVVRNASGQTVKMVGIVQDITDSRIASDRLRESEERYRVLFDESPLPILLFDPENLAIAAVNDLAVRHYGYTREEFLAKTLPELWPPETVGPTPAEISSNTAFRGVRRHVKKGGGQITVEVVAHEVVLAGRSYRMAVMRDITNQLELEEQLRQSQKMEAVGRLAGGVAHDFNNLLTVILGYGEMALAGLPPDSRQRQMIGEVLTAGERAANLTRQLLAFSRKQVIQPKVFDINQLVSSIDNLLRRLIGEDIDVLTVRDPDLGRVMVDPNQIEQVIVNLAVNARDAMPHGGRLTIETRNVDIADCAAPANPEPGRWVMLGVSDSGVGMDVETQAHAFEPFFTTKETGKGTGLGLAMVYGTVKQAGGCISLRSEPDHGTAVEIYLPRVEKHSASQPTVEEAVPLRTGTEVILLVEDEEQLRALMRNVLEGRGYRVLVAGNGQEGLALAASHAGPIDILITDVVMPVMSGPELATKIAASRPDTRTLFVSGYMDDTIVHHGVLDPGIRLLQKPFTPDAFSRRVREVLDEERQNRAS